MPMQPAKTHTNLLFTSLLLSCFVLGAPLISAGVAGSEHHHRTKAASEKQNDLWCYRCDSMSDGERCQDLQDNATSLHMKCSKEHKKCQVKRISVSTSTKDTVGKPKLWLLQRNCSENCEPGCIIIGERTKLHSCITCCENSFCNSGSCAEKVALTIICLVVSLVCWPLYKLTRSVC